MSVHKQYVCGFSGFGQIEQCIADTEGATQKSARCPDSGGATQKSTRCSDSGVAIPNLPNFYSLPQEIHSELILCTWFQIWAKTGNNLLTCYGFNSKTVMSKLKARNALVADALAAVQLTADTLLQTGRDILLKNNKELILIDENGEIHQVMADADVSLLDATQNMVYGFKEGQFCEGHIQKPTNDDDCLVLYLHPVTVSIEVQSVSCGFEHTLMMTLHGGVYSCGSGSRGQLGHGEVTVDVVKSPCLVDTFTGLCVVGIAAGGWHSTAVTDCGDVYVWGWNAHGQLGLPTGTISTNPDTATDTCHSQSNNDDDDDDAKLNNCHTTCSCAEECSQLKIHACKRKRKGSDEETICKRQEVDSTLIGSLGRHKHVSQSKKGSNISDCGSRFQTDDLGCERIKFYQSIDCVQTQTVPYGLDLGDEMFVKTVSCGTRHTCILSVDGTLLTTGWNSYGQLCLGDTISRDYLQTVTYFSEREEKAVDVCAQAWNTYILTEKG